MAIMIPDEIRKAAEPSEKIIFNGLKHAAQARNWMVFPSLYVKNSGNPKRPRELDFIILIPKYCSVICLEAKGGHYEIRERKWYHRNTNRSLRSPLDQSKDAMFALQDQFGSGSGLSFGCAVAFTDGEIPNSAPDHLAEMITSRDARDSDSLVQILDKHADQMRPLKIKERLCNPSKFKNAQEMLYKLRKKLEEEVEIGPEDPKKIFSSDLETRLPQLLDLTADQINTLDILKENPRCAINGAAGTGKTVLAMELARRRCEAGETVALLCSNPNLSHRFELWAEGVSDENSGEIVAGTPATLLSRIFREGSVSSERHKRRLADSPELEKSLKFGYLDTKWSSFVDETVKDLGQGDIFDYLIVDEAQNLCDKIFLKLMDKLLKKGLANGCFTMFGDFTYQDIVSHQRISDGRKSLKCFIKSRDLPGITLRNNCRNTHQIVETMAKLTKIESPPLSGVHGPEVQIEYFGSKEPLGKVLNRQVGSLKGKKFLSRQIILLSSDDDGFAAADSYGGWKLSNIHEAVVEAPRDEEDVVVANESLPDDILRYSDIYDFQGLESEVAILVIPVTDNRVVIGGSVTLPYEKHLRKMLYTGMSRAKAMLIIVADESYRKIIERRLTITAPPSRP